MSESELANKQNDRQGNGILTLTIGKLVRLSSGVEGRVIMMRILSSGLPVESCRLHPDMEPMVVTVGTKTFSAKRLIRRPEEITLLNPPAQNGDNEAEGFSAVEKEAFDNEVAFGEEGDDGNPFQDLMDGFYEGDSGERGQDSWF